MKLDLFRSAVIKASPKTVPVFEAPQLQLGRTRVPQREVIPAEKEKIPVEDCILCSAS